MQLQDWKITQQVMLKYQTSLNKIVRHIKDVTRNLKTEEEIRKTLQELAYSKDYQEIAYIIAKRFVTSANMVNARTWREAARKSSKSRRIYEALMKSLDHNIGITVSQQIENNAYLIKTLPLNISKEITKYVGTKAFSGIRSSDIAKMLTFKVGEYSSANVNTIARTESSKAMEALTEARSRDIGVKMYYWRTANDGLRVRESHRHMKDVIVFWDDPPAPEELIGEKSAGHYHAGRIYNCRCFARPIIDLDTIEFPCKVYRNGQIVTMNKSQFMKII